MQDFTVGHGPLVRIKIYSKNKTKQNKTNRTSFKVHVYWSIDHAL
jgi:hypothetical protein